ncbi:MAG: hypothetical protein HYU56_03160 [Candidatus Aenigmarchaeota archaeon]|nr:hypothetical protein [Candidatus Aenigmarchaeota archaeon]
MPVAEHVPVDRIEDAPQRFHAPFERFMRDHPCVNPRGISYSDHGPWGILFVATREDGLDVKYAELVFGDGREYADLSSRL